METATLTSPPRPVMVQPIQKSLSLPSYARASGEGIDHKLIFAALEQREKVRRKSKIFKDKEKTGTTRQNYFCLPLPTGSKCRETSFSSDTSCSSLEFQKPKASVAPPPKSKKIPHHEQNGLNYNAHDTPSPDPIVKTDVNNNSDEGNPVSVPQKDCIQRERPVPIDAPKSAIGSSDSMEKAEKSSKSSNDSLSRKERLVAIKARVEAEREKKLGDSSSEEEETILRITRHNSDGVIHRTVREVKAKSSRAEKRYRRRTPEECAARRNARKQHRSLYLPSSVDLDSSKPPIIRSGSTFTLQKDLDSFTKDFLNVDDKLQLFHFQPVSKDQYFSDICSGSCKSRFFKPANNEIKAKEHKQRFDRDSVLNRSVAGDRSKQNVSPNEMSLDISPHSSFSSVEIKSSSFPYGNLQKCDRNCVSPTFRAPTPPPRSPKSIKLVNQMLLQHQNSTTAQYFYHEASSLERKKTLRSDTSAQPTVNQSSSLDSIKSDLLNSCRKTVLNSGKSVLRDENNGCDKSVTSDFQPQNKTFAHHFPPRSPDLSQRLSGSARKFKLLDLSSTKGPIDPGKRWEKIEVDSEKAFNSLEGKARSSDTEWKICRLFPKRMLNTLCSCESPGVFACNCKEVSQSFYRESLCQRGLKRDLTSSQNLLREKVNKGNLSLTQNCPKLPSPESRRSIIARLRLQEEMNKDFSFSTRSDAKENLNTAMEELENVYRSLRVSNENLSADRNKVDLLSKTADGSRHSSWDRKTSMFCKTEYTQNETIYFQSDLIEKPKDEPSIKEALCIDELFGDLTEQLELEQRLLEEMKQKSSGSPTGKGRNLEGSLFYESSQFHQSLDSEKIRTFIADKHANDLSEVKSVKERLLAKKKHKAVRSLSANIASIMQCDSLIAARQRTREETQNENRNPPTLNFGNTMLGPERPIENTSIAPTKTNNPKEEREKREDCDEIWQVRVSMDPGSSPGQPRLPSETASTYSRLHSALRRQNENIVQGDDPSAVQDLKKRTPVSSSAVRLSENELEKLLTTLLRDVSNKPIPEKRNSSPTTKDISENESAILTKGPFGYVRRRLFAQNMDPGISSQSRTTNEKQLAELLPSSSSRPGSVVLDNNSNQNNNDTVDVHCSSFMPSREQQFSLTYRVSDDNRSLSLASYRKSACVENLCHPRTSWLNSRGAGRRHSIGLDDFSDVSIFSGYRNFNQEKRPTTFNHMPVAHCSSDTAANPSSAVNQSKHICQSEFVESENQNQARNVEFTVRNACNSRMPDHVNLNPTQAAEKFKDKSFVRKSSLNRLEFVEQACHNAVRKSQVHSSNQQSSSEVNSDQECSHSLTSVSSLLTKCKNTLSHFTEKEQWEELTRQDAVLEVADGGARKGGLVFKHHEMSSKFRNRKHLGALAHPFKNKSLSAGEQDSFSDFIENTAKNKVCFSAQEIHPVDLMQDDRHEEFSSSLERDQSKQTVQCSATGALSSLDALNKGLQTALSVSSACDNSSHVSTKPEQLPTPSSFCTVEGDVSHPSDNNELENVCQNDLGVNGACGMQHLDLDQDLFESHTSMTSLPLHPFPINDQSAADLNTSENNEISAPSSPITACSQQSIVNSAALTSEIPVEAVESLCIKNCIAVESEKETKQPSSILRKKYGEEKREIHGILKNAEDKLASRFLPSILKHRESSEEKDVCLQSDLHSILKKSTSEEDSSNNSPDIRPILKNTSTDDESSGVSSKPKPILKKRTSFSEECSYACFHSGELKPILKKKSIIDTCEEQPRPILKTRRKSEEAAATTLEFAIGSRPRAYSADRGVKMVTEKKSIDDLS